MIKTQYTHFLEIGFINSGFFWRYYYEATCKRRVAAKQPVHWILGGKGLSIQQGTSVWVGLRKSKRRASKDSHFSYPAIELELQPVRCTSVIWLLFLNQTPIFDWCVVQWGSKNKHHKDTCLKPSQTTFSYFINCFIHYNGHNQENLHNWLKNQQPYTSDNHKDVKGSPIFNLIFCYCFIMDLLVQHNLKTCI